eukprot:snap_masked-scaffold_2-processed-gene-7.44-mRNA-1 protein AED:0.19 eAED:0.20 QI:0/-1/0/1/-1/1/1/0/425
MLKYLRKLNGEKRANYDLKVVSGLARELGLLNQENVNVYHVVGTNGKGSVANKLHYGLGELYGQESVGLFTSPHLFSIRERIKVGNQNISYKKLEVLSEEVSSAALNLGLKPTFFEALTLSALLYFREKKCANLVLEAGLGGKNDSTNIPVSIKPTKCMLTSVALDHTNILGNSLEAICEEKCGIFSENSSVFIGPSVDLSLKPVVHKMVQKYKSKEAVFSRVEVDDINFINSTLVLDVLRSEPTFEEKHEAMKYDICDVSSFGRFEVTSADSYPKTDFVFDVSHNPEALAELRKRLNKNFPDKKVIVVLSMATNKNIEECFSVLFDDFQNLKQIIFLESQSKRLHSAAHLQQIYQKTNLCNSSSSISSANYLLDNLAKFSQQDNVVLVCGSFFLMKEVKLALGLISQEYVDPFDLNEATISNNN